MSFTGNFSVTQSATDPASLTFVDTSTGSDTNITSRRIYPRNAAGSLVLPAGNTSGYINWTLPLGTNLTVSLLSKDLALAIEVVYISSSPLPSSTYDVTKLYGFTFYTLNFLYSLIQQITANQTLLNDNGFRTNMFYLSQEVINCNLSITPKQSILNAQAALDRAYYLIVNSNKFF